MQSRRRNKCGTGERVLTSPPFCTTLALSHSTQRLQVRTILAAEFPFVLADDLEGPLTIRSSTETKSCTPQMVYMNGAQNGWNNTDRTNGCRILRGVPPKRTEARKSDVARSLYRAQDEVED